MSNYYHIAYIKVYMYRDNRSIMNNFQGNQMGREEFDRRNMREDFDRRNMRDDFDRRHMRDEFDR